VPPSFPGRAGALGEPSARRTERSGPLTAPPPPPPTHRPFRLRRRSSRDHSPPARPPDSHRLRLAAGPPGRLLSPIVASRFGCAV